MTLRSVPDDPSWGSARSESGEVSIGKARIKGRRSTSRSRGLGGGDASSQGSEGHLTCWTCGSAWMPRRRPPEPGLCPWSADARHYRPHQNPVCADLKSIEFPPARAWRVRTRWVDDAEQGGLFRSPTARGFSWSLMRCYAWGSSASRDGDTYVCCEGRRAKHVLRWPSPAARGQPPMSTIDSHPAGARRCR
jgi:hypothetical protein